MQTLYVPKYNLHYRVNPRNPRELQWSRKPFGPATQWQHAMSFRNPIRALDLDDETKQGVVVLNDSTTYVGSGVRTWGRKFYPAGTRIYSLYAIGESLDIKVGTGKEFDCLRYCSTLELPNGVCVPVRACIRCMRFAAFTFRVVGFGEVDPELYPDAGTAKCFIHGYYPVYGPEHKPSDEFVIYCDDVSELQKWSDRNGWGVGIGKDAPSMAVDKEIETNKKLGLIPEKRKTMSKIRIKVNEGKRELRNKLYNALKPINGKFYNKSRSVLALDDFKRIMDGTLPDGMHYTLGSLHDGMKLDRDGSGHFWFEFPFSVQEDGTMKEVLSGLITLSPAGTEDDPMHRYDTTIQIF